MSSTDDHPWRWMNGQSCIVMKTTAEYHVGMISAIRDREQDTDVYFIGGQQKHFFVLPKLSHKDHSNFSGQKYFYFLITMALRA